MKKKFNIKKSTVIITSIVGTVAVCAGIGLGLYFGNGYFDKGINYNAYNAVNLEDDITKTMNKYNRSNNDYSSFTASELANIALYNYAQSNASSSAAEGSVLSAGITQIVNSTSTKSEGVYFNESLSASSLVKVAKRFYQTGDSVVIYEGNDLQDATSASWSEDRKSTLSTTEYEDAWGRTLERPLIYIISSKTVLESSINMTDSNEYIVSFDLDPVKSVLRYVKQMVSMSNLSKTPKFSKVHVELTLSNDLMLKESSIQEEYEVYVLGYHQTQATLKEIFTNSDINLTIPDLNTNCQY